MGRLEPGNPGEIVQNNVAVAVQEREYFADLAQRELEHRANGVQPGDVRQTGHSIWIATSIQHVMRLGSNKHGTRRVEGGTEPINCHKCAIGVQIKPKSRVRSCDCGLVTDQPAAAEVPAGT